MKRKQADRDTTTDCGVERAPVHPVIRALQLLSLVLMGGGCAGDCSSVDDGMDVILGDGKIVFANNGKIDFLTINKPTKKYDIATKSGDLKASQAGFMTAGEARDVVFTKYTTSQRKSLFGWAADIDDNVYLIVEVPGGSIEEFGYSDKANSWCLSVTINGQQDLYVYDGTLRRLTDTPESETGPGFSGDGQRLLFSKGGKIFQLDWKSQSPEPMPFGNPQVEGYYPRALGSATIYCAYTGASYAIKVVGPTGNHLDTLASNLTRVTEPSVSPDQLFFVITQTQGEQTTYTVFPTDSGDAVGPIECKPTDLYTGRASW